MEPGWNQVRENSREGQNREEIRNRFGAYNSFQALAGMAKGKGIKTGAMPIEMFQKMNYRSKIKYWRLQQDYYSDLDIRQPGTWDHLEYFGIPKNLKTTDFDTMRWIGKAEVGEKWFSRALGPVVQKEIKEHKTLSYGFSKGCSPDDFVGIVRN